MLKIKSISFVKSVYDESMSHQVFSIANIEFSNAEPIHGALLYWRQNDNEDLFTKDNEYKFFYDVSQTKFYAAVKFPQYTDLTKDQMQELAFILLEQRGFIGSYSFQTNKNATNVFKIHLLFKQLDFPAEFSPKHFKNYFHLLSETEIEAFIEEYPFYSKQFVKGYSEWTQLLCQAHPSQFEKYMPYVQMNQVCYQNPYLTQSFIIDYLDLIDFATLQFNLPVIDRLSKFTRKYMLVKLKADNETLQMDLMEQSTLVIDSIDFYAADRMFYLPQEQDDNGIFGPFNYFEYDLGRYTWPGSEHLVKGIPSYAAQLYTVNGERRLSNTEMDERLNTFNAEQLMLFENSCELHWLNRYKKQLNWTNICLYNPNLTEAFITKHEKYIDFEALALNTQCQLSPSFIDKHFYKLLSQQVSPVILKSLTPAIYEKYSDRLKLSQKMISLVAHLLTEEQLHVLECLSE